ncbi:MAG: IS200/IS605 family transposase [bacterium]|nr:IS200/IS605 family transposase [bacterium]
MYHCQYHIVFPTKYRRAIFNDGVFAYLKDKLLEIGKHYPEIDFIETNHDETHIHLLVSIPPKMSVSTFVRMVKANTSRGLKPNFHF